MPASLPDINVAYFQNLLLERRRASLMRIDERTLAERDSTAASEGLRETQDPGDNSVREVAQDARFSDAQRATSEVHLLDAALAHAQQQGCLRVTLLTDADNHAAQRQLRTPVGTVVGPGMGLALCVAPQHHALAQQGHGQQIGAELVMGGNGVPQGVFQQQNALLLDVNPSR